MFGALILNRIGGNVHGVDVVTIHHGSTVRRRMEHTEARRSQEASAMAMATPRYSASALDRDTIFWRLEDQETRLYPRNTA